MGRGAEKGEPRLVDSGGSDHLGVTDDELLGAGWRLRGEAWHACAATGQVAENRRVVVVVVERPVAGLAVVKIDPLPNLVVANCIFVAVVGIRT